MKHFLLLVALLALSGASAFPQTKATVSVLYAGSLVTPMEGPIKSALASQGVVFQGEPGGSRELAHFIASGLRNPDIFLSVDPKLVTNLGSKVASAVTFGGTSLGIGWSKASKYAPLFASVAAGKVSLLTALATPGLRIARTDPRLDPKGGYTIAAMTMLAGSRVEHHLLGTDENSAQTFPEEDLLVRLETGEADVGFVYKTEAVARKLHFIALAGSAAMRDKITYTLAILRNAPHPAQARAFVRFLLTQRGKTILQDAGVTYLRHPRTLVVPK